MKREMPYGSQVRKNVQTIWISRETHAKLKQKARVQGRVVYRLADDLIRCGLNGKCDCAKG